MYSVKGATCDGNDSKCAPWRIKRGRPSHEHIARNPLRRPPSAARVSHTSLLMPVSMQTKCAYLRGYDVLVGKVCQEELSGHPWIVDLAKLLTLVLLISHRTIPSGVRVCVTHIIFHDQSSLSRPVQDERLALGDRMGWE